MTTPPAPRRPHPSFAESAPLGRFVILSAATGENADGEIPGDAQAQTRQALERLRRAAERAGVPLDRAVKVHVYLRHASDFAAMNAAYAPAFPAEPPARTTIVADLPDPRALVAIAMVLVRPGEPREIVQPPGWPPPANPYSYGVRCGDTLFMAGLVPRRGADNVLVTGDAAVQTQAVIENARGVLAAAGFTLQDVVSSRVYVSRAAAFAGMNQAYREAFPVDPPARATVVTGLMSDEFDVEITLVAVKDAARTIVGPAGPLPLSPAVAAGGRVFVSGMLGNTEATRGDVVAQTAEMMRRIHRTLEQAGLGWEEVGEAILYVTGIEAAGAVIAEMAAAFPRGLPGGVVVGTGLVAPEGLVELMVTAAR